MERTTNSNYKLIGEEEPVICYHSYIRNIDNWISMNIYIIKKIYEKNCLYIFIINKNLYIYDEFKNKKFKNLILCMINFNIIILIIYYYICYLPNLF